MHTMCSAVVNFRPHHI